MVQPILSLNDVQVSPDSLPQQPSDASNVIFLINFRNHRDMYPPFGIMYVADALEQVGFTCRVFHETAEFLEEFIAQVAEERPLVAEELPLVAAWPLARAFLPANMPLIRLPCCSSMVRKRGKVASTLCFSASAL